MNEIIKTLLLLLQEIKEVKELVIKLKKTRAQKFNENWIDGQEVMLALFISQRTLQSLRDTGILPYSRIKGKIYYKLTDIEKLLESNYSRNLKSDCHD